MIKIEKIKITGCKSPVKEIGIFGNNFHNKTILAATTNNPNI
jgi:hypothetical protein